MSTATARVYQPYFAGRFVPFEMQKSPQNKAFYGYRSTYSGKAHCIKDSVLLDPACGSGGMFVSSADFIAQYGANANMTMTFYGQEKVEYNARLCLMNMAVHGLNAKIVSGDAANSFYNDHFALEGKCDFLMANEAVICGLTPEKARNIKEFAA